MITPSFGMTATERVLPKLALDFTTASLDSRITFTRANAALQEAVAKIESLTQRIEALEYTKQGE